MPLLGVRVVVILHQSAEEDDEDDLQDDAGERQLQPHVGRSICHGWDGLLLDLLSPGLRAGMRGLKYPTNSPHRTELSLSLSLSFSHTLWWLQGGEWRSQQIDT